MRLTRWTIAGCAAALVLAPAVAVADPPGATVPMDFQDSADDAPTAVDITNVHVYRTAADYRATMKLTDLRTQDGNRYYVGFNDGNDGRPTGIPSSAYNGNLVEFRRTPGGQEKTVAYKTYNGNFATGATCSGVRAVPDYTRSKITFVIPNACWKGTSGVARVTAGAKHYAPGTFETNDAPPATGGSDTRSDLLDESGGWVYASLRASS